MSYFQSDVKVCWSRCSSQVAILYDNMSSKDVQGRLAYISVVVKHGSRRLSGDPSCMAGRGASESTILVG